MQQTESKSIQIHPNDEQYFIDVMQKFHWNLQSTQTVDTKESHMETRKDKLYSVTNTQKYVKLHFIRPMMFPNKEKFQRLQDEFFGFPTPEPKSTKGPMYTMAFGVLMLILSVCASTATKGSFFSNPLSIIGLILLIAGVAWIVFVSKANGEINNVGKEQQKRRDEIIAECNSLHLENP